MMFPSKEQAKQKKIQIMTHDKKSYEISQKYPHLLVALARFGRGGWFTIPIEKIIQEKATIEEMKFVIEWLAGMNYVPSAFIEINQAIIERIKKEPNEYLEYKLKKHYNLWPHIPLERCFEEVCREISQGSLKYGLQTR